MTAVALPIAWVHPRRCTLRFPLQRGEVRRHGWPGSPSKPFLYDIACPSCGVVNTWLAGKPGTPPVNEGKLVEVRPPVDDEDDRLDDRTLEVWKHPSSITSSRVERCVGCSRGLTITDGAVIAAVVVSPA
jgi:hypothetical protein